MTLPLALALVLALAGCANRGNPRPPSLHLPAPAADLKAERVGDSVLLTWTTSDKTSDGLLLHAPITAVLCRDTVVHGPARTTVCTPISRRSAVPGLSQAAETLPPALLADPPTLLAYRVELMNQKSRSAGLSAPAYAPSGAAPPDPGAIAVTATRRGAIIEWTPMPSSGVMQLTRTFVQDSAEPAPAPAAPPVKPGRGLPASKPTDPGTPVLLRDSASGVPDPGGLLDPAVLPHHTYTYTAQRVRTVLLEGQAYRLSSAASPAFRFSYRDVFPPQAPRGLESIAAAPATGTPSIDLSWDANNESDILGYNVYRAALSSGDFTRLNPQPLPSPSFRDTTAQPGHVYRYRVTALDRSSNEGKPSVEIQDSLPNQP